MTVFTDFEKQPLVFLEPKAFVRCERLEDIPGAFKTVESWLKEGRHVAGFLSYEAGYAFEPQLHQDRAFDFPLMFMAAYEKPRRCRLKACQRGNFSLACLRTNISREEYFEDIHRIRKEIADGEVYQITYCLKVKFRFSGDSLAFYDELFRAQPVPYAAMVHFDDTHILSLSPERFMKKNGQRMVVEPMKGTWPRGRYFWDDLVERRRFRKDRKNRAENVMIVDLLRNDLGRVGSRITVPRLFTVTPYRTLFQMTSTVTGQVSSETPIGEFFKALFPSGSVTGAPKVRAMEIIRELEREDRRIYTGAIGYITPKRDFYFNIPIRTVLLRGVEGEMGIGGGIVWDSTPEGEWQEGLIKVRFLTNMVGNIDREL